MWCMLASYCKYMDIITILTKPGYRGSRQGSYFKTNFTWLIYEIKPFERVIQALIMLWRITCLLKLESGHVLYFIAALGWGLWRNESSLQKSMNFCRCPKVRQPLLLSWNIWGPGPMDFSGLSSKSMFCSSLESHRGWAL